MTDIAGENAKGCSLGSWFEAFLYLHIGDGGGAPLKV